VVVKVILNWVLTAIPSLGIKGASWATVADIGVAALMNLYFVHRYVGFAMEMKSLAKTIVASAAMGGVIYVIYDFVILHTASIGLATLVGMLFGAIVYAGVLLLVGGIVEGDVKQLPFIGARLAPILRKFGLFK